MSKEEQIEQMARTIDELLVEKPKETTKHAMNVATYLFDRGYRKQEWISVEDRLPEECKNVLCFEGKKIVIAFMEKTEDCGEDVPVFWDWVAYDRDDTYDEVCATHWMPLPEPPKMKGGAE